MNPSSSSQRGPLIIEGLDHVALVVRDLRGSIAWYERVLGLERKHQDAWGDVPALLVTPGGGQSGVALFPLSGDAPESLPERWYALVVDHVAFRVDRKNFEAAQKRLRELDIEFNFEDHTISHSIYFEDLDRHRLEITTYEI